MRTKKNHKRIPNLDPVYKNMIVTKLINRVMFDGKKTVAQAQVYKALKLLKEKTGQEPLSVLIAGFENVKPQMEVRARRLGGAAYQVPTPVRSDRQESLAIRWLIMAATARPSREYHTFAEKLAAEVIDAVANTGGAIKKKLDTHRMAEANKAFAHFRW